MGWGTNGKCAPSAGAGTRMGDKEFSSLPVSYGFCVVVVEVLPPGYGTGRCCSADSSFMNMLCK